MRAPTSSEVRAALRHEYGAGVADGIATTLKLLLGREIGAGEPFHGELTEEIRVWAEDALARISEHHDTPAMS